MIAAAAPRRHRWLAALLVLAALVGCAAPPTRTAQAYRSPYAQDDPGASRGGSEGGGGGGGGGM